MGKGGQGRGSWARVPFNLKRKSKFFCVPLRSGDALVASMDTISALLKSWLSIKGSHIQPYSMVCKYPPKTLLTLLGDHSQPSKQIGCRAEMELHWKENEDMKCACGTRDWLPEHGPPAQPESATTPSYGTRNQKTSIREYLFKSLNLVLVWW